MFILFVLNIMKTFFVVTILSFDKNTYSDYFSCDDLFTYVAYGNEKRRTITKWNQACPSWNEDLVFTFHSEMDHINIAVMDEDRWKPSEKVWERTIPIEKKNIGKVINVDSLSLVYDICVMSSFKSLLQEKKEELDKLKMIMSQVDEVIDNKQEDLHDLELNNFDVCQSGLLN